MYFQGAGVFCQWTQMFDEPEKISLNLPSAFVVDEQRDRGLLAMAAVEHQLREVFAHNALNDVKHAILLKLANLTARRTHVRGQHDSTRAAQVINKQAASINRYRATYSRHRNSLLALGLSPSDLVFRELRREDCEIKSYTGQLTPHTSKTSNSKNQPASWIWRNGIKLPMVEDPGWALEGIANV